MVHPSDASPEQEFDDGARPSPLLSGAEIGGYVKRGVFLALLIMVISLVAPQIVDRVLEVLSSAERLRTIHAGWFFVMIGLEFISFVFMWWLIRIVLPEVSWFVAATSQLTSNAVSRVVPGGAAVGGAALYRMLSVSGVTATKAAGALAATSIVSTAALFAIPATALLLAIFGAPVPEDLLHVAIAGGVLFLALVGFGAIAISYDRPLVSLGRVLNRVFGALGRPFRKDWSVDPSHLIAERNRLVSVIGPKWPQVTAAAALNWVFDYLTLVAALYAVGADPRLSLVLLAYSTSAVLSMIPITPGGFGFVEVGLTAALVVSGISTQNALLATLSYRIISLWVPLASGIAAWVTFRSRYQLRE